MEFEGSVAGRSQWHDIKPGDVFLMRPRTVPFDNNPWCGPYVKLTNNSTKWKMVDLKTGSLESLIESTIGYEFLPVPGKFVVN
jgi:hypothetical protein